MLDFSYNVRIFAEFFYSFTLKTFTMTFIFKMFTRASGLEIEVGRVSITAKNYDAAAAIYRRKDLPFHHFATVELSK